MKVIGRGKNSIVILQSWLSFLLYKVLLIIFYISLPISCVALKHVRMLSWTLVSLFYLYLLCILSVIPHLEMHGCFPRNQSRSSYLSHNHLCLIAKGIGVSCFLETSADPEITSFSHYKGIIKCERSRFMWRLWPCFLPCQNSENFSNKKTKTATQNFIPLNCYTVLTIIYNSLHCLM